MVLTHANVAGLMFEVLFDFNCLQFPEGLKLIYKCPTENFKKDMTVHLCNSSCPCFVPQFLQEGKSLIDLTNSVSIYSKFLLEHGIWTG